ncbi:ATP-binding protein [Fimicolochytrium jonesii]|uniref:ATP-binding protein n=1 Tax=Fimicolochytrium jonesii TaxID=1396493 RepID=UPI0022FDBE1A|nr:ATP-binding protein [Fimicolochytrium jonesii]KAI8825669.1 ATP binding domain 4-like protein [Fimicolochytrium jonesii]
MKVVALISGGKDSCFNMMHCVANGHKIVALANLKPAVSSGKDELDSYMYQTVGHDAIDMYSGCMDLPMFRREIQGQSISRGSDYRPTVEDEVEDLYELLSEVKRSIPNVEAVATGAILSNYQRVRVENVCSRLGLTSLAYLWERDQKELMQEMIASGLHSILIKVACMGLTPKHLGQSLAEVHPHLLRLNERYGAHVCGEGGEFETFTLDCPLFIKRIVIDKMEEVIHSDDGVVTVAYLRIVKCHLEVKNVEETGLSENLREELVQNPMAVEEYAGDVDDVEWGSVSRTVLPESTISAESTTDTSYEWPICSRRATYLAFSGVDIHTEGVNPTRQNNLTAHQEIIMVMDSMQSRLAKQSLTWDNVLNMHVNVRDMEDFATLNASYKSYFGINPPPRVTIQVPLPPTTRLQIDLLAYTSPNPHQQKSTLHVQSLSYWAPANIGPYSQLASTPSQIHLAGQIALVPHTMKFVNATTPGAELSVKAFKEEARLALRHVGRVLATRGVGLEEARMCVGYVTDVRFVDVARRVWLGKARASVPAVFIVVPRLPRDANIEWHITCGTPGQSRADDDDDEDDSAVEEDTSARTTQAKAETSTASIWKVQGLRNDQTGYIIGTLGFKDPSGLTSGDALSGLVEELSAPFLRALHELRFTPQHLMNLRVFHHHKLPKSWVSQALKSRELFSTSSSAVTLIPVSAIEETDALMAICATACI